MASVEKRSAKSTSWMCRAKAKKVHCSAKAARPGFVLGVGRWRWWGGGGVGGDVCLFVSSLWCVDDMVCLDWVPPSLYGAWTARWLLHAPICMATFSPNCGTMTRTSAPSESIVQTPKTDMSSPRVTWGCGCTVES